MAEWREISIGELGRVVTGATPRTGDDAAWGDAIDFVTPTEMSYSSREPASCRKLSEGGLETLRRRMIPSGSVLFACIGFSTGKVAQVSSPAVTNQQVNSLVPDPAVVDWRFAYYLLRAKSPAIRAIANGSTTPIVNKSMFQSISVLLPSMSEQRVVSDVLGALDDKIAVNERIAAAVDDLAAALFEDLLTADPGAEVLLGDVADVNVRTVKAQDSGSLRYVDISSVGVGSYEWPEEMPWSDAPGRARRKAAVGDTIWSTVRPNRRSHALVLDQDPDLVFSTGLAVISPQSVGPAFLYESTRLTAFQAYLESVAEGSAYPAVRADRFKKAPIALPSEDARFRFEESAMPMRLRSHQAQMESRTLAALRDTLLPQLMSGRLRIKDAEKIVEDHV
ncbi:restriction endonuclease subunit S [Streptomyces parvulus]|uniref:restriction endonuclease subunit S n=1 Tax=Streptomyces parvulus TaxID=146923 RepID=UPI003422B0D8